MWAAGVRVEKAMPLLTFRECDEVFLKLIRYSPGRKKKGSVDSNYKRRPRSRRCIRWEEGSSSTCRPTAGKKWDGGLFAAKAQKDQGFPRSPACLWLVIGQIP